MSRKEKVKQGFVFRYLRYSTFYHAHSLGDPFTQKQALKESNLVQNALRPSFEVSSKVSGVSFCSSICAFADE